MNDVFIDVAAITVIIAFIVNEIRNYKGTKESLQEIINDLRKIREKLRGR